MTECKKKKKKESVQENEMCKVHWDLEMQTNHLLLFRRPDLE